jgi:hypothetical protein
MPEIKTDIITDNVDPKMINIIRAENEYHTNGDAFLDDMITAAMESRIFDERYGF